MLNPKLIQKIFLFTLLLAGTAFIIFALFFNRATLQISAQVPFSVNIENLRSEYCQSSPCSIVLAPGKYQYTLTKSDFQPVTDQVELTRGQSTLKQYQFSAVPQLQAIGDWNPKQLFAQKNNFSFYLLNLDLTIKSTFWTQLENSLSDISPINFQISPDGQTYVVDDGKIIQRISLANTEQAPVSLPFPSGSPYFFINSKALLYLANAPKTNSPTLFLLALDDQSLKPLTLISFIRQIKQARLVANSNHTKIALLDQTDASNIGLYLIDTESNTRKILDQGPGLLDAKWLSDNTFLLEKRNQVTKKSDLFVVNPTIPSLTQLDLHQNLSAIAVLNPLTLLLAENETDPTQTSSNSGFYLEKYTIPTSSTASRREKIYYAADLALPHKIQYDQTLKRLLFLSDQTIYSLNLEL